MLSLRDEVLETATGVAEQLRALSERLVPSDRELDRNFWLEAMTRAVTPCDEDTLTRLGLDRGTLILFDRRQDAEPIEQRTRFEDAKTPSGRAVRVLRA